MLFIKNNIVIWLLILISQFSFSQKSEEDTYIYAAYDQLLGSSHQLIEKDYQPIYDKLLEISITTTNAVTRVRSLNILGQFCNNYNLPEKAVLYGTKIIKLLKNKKDVLSEKRKVAAYNILAIGIQTARIAKASCKLAYQRN